MYEFSLSALWCGDILVDCIAVLRRFCAYLFSILTKHRMVFCLTWWPASAVVRSSSIWAAHSHEPFDLESLYFTRTSILTYSTATPDMMTSWTTSFRKLSWKKNISKVPPLVASSRILWRGILPGPTHWWAFCQAKHPPEWRFCLLPWPQTVVVHSSSSLTKWAAFVTQERFDLESPNSIRTSILA